MLKLYIENYVRRKLCKQLIAEAHTAISSVSIANTANTARKSKKFLKDKADGTLVFTVISLPLIVIVMILSFSIAQLAADKNDLNSFMQRSAQAGVSKVNAYGSLNKNAVIEAVRNNMREQNTSNDTSAAYGNGGDHISSRFCSKVIEADNGVALTSEPAAYYMKVTLNEDRAIGTEKNNSSASNTLSYTGFEDGTVSPAPLTDMRSLGIDSNSRMKVINIEAKINLRSYWALPGTDPCITHDVNVSAITLGSSLDVDYDNDFSTPSN